MVHQHFMLVPVFTVTENVMLGDEDVKAAGVLDRKSAAAKIRKISEQYNLEVDPVLGRVELDVLDYPRGLQPKGRGEQGLDGKIHGGDDQVGRRRSGTDPAWCIKSNSTGNGIEPFIF